MVTLRAGTSTRCTTPRAACVATPGDRDEAGDLSVTRRQFAAANVQTRRKSKRRGKGSEALSSAVDLQRLGALRRVDSGDGRAGEIGMVDRGDVEILLDDAAGHANERDVPG